MERNEELVLFVQQARLQYIERVKQNKGVNTSRLMRKLYGMVLSGLGWESNPLTRGLFLSEWERQSTEAIRKLARERELTSRERDPFPPYFGGKTRRRRTPTR